MVDQPTNSKTARRRLRVQFSLQTLLVLTLVVAVACAWFLAPRYEDETWAGGALKIRAEKGPSETQAVNNPQPSTEPAWHGRWILYDAQNRKLAAGSYNQDAPAGTWTYFDGAGRPVLQGTAQEGRVVGLWTARHAGGEISQQIVFKRREIPMVATAPQPVIPGKSAIVSAESTARTFWENGNLRSEGRYRNNLREGPWKFFDREGRKEAEGPYRRGVRQGTWKEYPAGGGRAVVEYYVRGRPIGNVAQLVARLETELFNSERKRQIGAAIELRAIGAPAVPVFARALAEKEPGRQLMAIDALRQSGDDASAAADELAMVCESEHLRVRFAAMVALAEIDPQRAPQLYAALLTAAGDATTRERQWQAETALLRIGPQGLKEVQRLLHSPEAKFWTPAMDLLCVLHTRQTIAPHLADAATAKAVREIMELAAKHPDPEISKRAKDSVTGQSLPGGLF
jgi:antitoxin component YwqK of YwqJK toxin-antitoxin module